MEEELSKILKFYGAENQYREFNSEIGELAIELASFFTPNVYKEKEKVITEYEQHEKLLTEFADAYIMLRQMMLATGISTEEWCKEIDYKVERQKKRIEKKRKELQE